MILPFTCEQIRWTVLIGLLGLIVLGVIFTDGFLIIVGGGVALVAWTMQIIIWVEDGKIKCRCEK